MSPSARTLAFVVTTLGLGVPGLAMAEGSADPVLVEASRLALRDDHTAPIDVRRRTISFAAKTKRSAPANRVTAPTRGGDSDPTLAGGVLVFANTSGSGERVQVALPASCWRALGTPAKPKGFEYRDDSDAAPVRKVVVKPDALSVKARGPGWSYTLDEASQGSVGVRLHLGATDWCANAPARTSGTPPTSAKFDRIDKFDGARHSRPPALSRLRPSNSR